MASTDKKKVKITETSKQANVDIISETIQLPADSADHTLVAKVPSSANCTSGVNVEVEMSPDGVNWCPALRKEVTTTSGGTAAEIIGNEKYVDLEKNDPVFNSYAKGGLNFDANGNEVALGTGARDLLDQHIAVNKSFNYSMWVKSDTLPDIARDETVTFTVTVAGGLFYINGNAQSNVYLKEGSTYTFDQSDSSNSGHPLRFSITDDGTHNSGVEYTTGVTVVGTPGSAGAYTQIVVAEDAVDLYYYCSNHSGMGASAFTPVSTPYKPVLFRHGGYDNFENAKTVQLTDGTGAGTVANTQAGFGETWYFSSFVNEGITPFDDYTVAYWWDSSVGGAPGISITANATWKGFTQPNSIFAGNLFAIGLNYPYYSVSPILNAASNSAPNFTFDGTSSYLIILRHKLNGNGTATATTNVFRDDGTAMVMDGSGGNTQFSTTYNVGSSYNTGADGGTIRPGNGINNMDECIILGGYVPDANLSTLYSTTATGIGVVDASTLSDIQAWYRFGDNGTDTKAAISNNITNPNRTTQFPGAVNTAFTSSDAIPTLSTSHALYSVGPQKITQNLCEPVSTSMSNNYYVAETTANNTDFYSYFSDIQLTSNKKWCISFWMKSSIFASTASGYYGNRIFGNFGGSSAGFQVRKKSGTTDVWQLFFNGNGGTYLVADYTIPSQHNVNNTWVHVLINYSYDSAANSGAISDSIYLASMDLYINGDVCSKADSTAYSSTTHATTLVSHGINNGVWANTPNIVEAYDELAYWDGTSLTTSEIAKVYNSGTPEDLQNTTGLTAPDHWWRHEDSSNLNYDTIAGANSGILAGDTQTAITSSDSIAPVTAGTFDNLFTTTSNLSISGWFKTTDTGTLFSNTEGAAASGLKLDVNASNMTLSFLDAPDSITINSDVNDGEWHHLVITKNDAGTNQFTVYVDGSQVVQASKSITDADLKGSNGFTLLGDGQNNAHATSPSSTDSSKLQATLSNWSVHSEVLSANAVKQLYSNGHVRNIKNLPSVNLNNIVSWWKLSDTTTPEEDLVGSNDLQYTGFYGARDKAIKADGDGTNPSSNGLQLTATSNNNPIGATSSDTTLDLTNGLGISMNIKCEGSVTVSSNFSRKNLFSIELTNGKTIEAIFEKSTSTNDLALILYISDATPYASTNTSANYINFPFGTALDDGNWHHLSINVTDDSNLIGSTARIYLDGVLQSWQSDFWTGGSPSSFSGLVNSISILGNDYNVGGTNILDMDVTIDNLGFFTGYPNNTDFDSTAATEIYNNRKNLSNSSSDFKSIFLMGDGANDVITPNSSISIEDTVSTDRVITPQANFHANSGVITLTSSEDPYYNIPTTDLTTEVVPATGATLVEKSINGNAMTLSITKNFNFTTESWVSDASGEAALCLSLNGFEEQAEYFALWKCSQTLPDGVVDVCDGNWHNIALSYRGQNDLAGDNVAEGDAVRFGRGSADNPFNFSLAIDGYPLYTEIGNNTGADYIGGNNTLITDTINSVTYNVGFNIYNRHLKYDPSNNNEQYRVHGQFGPAVHTYLPNENDPHSFRGEVDDTSFHSDPWWSNADGTNIDLFGADTSKRGNLFNQEKTYTLYGRTTALANRGTNATYGPGVPYPLLNPELLVTSGNITDIEGTNQFLNPVRKGDTQPWNSQVSTGGLEGWWRWGDTAGDCSITVNDVKDHNSTPAVDYRDIQAVYLTDQGTSSNVALATNESIYLQSQASTTTSGSAGVQYNQIKLEDLSTLIGTATCAVKDFVSPVLQYLRIKLTGSGTCDIGDGKLEIEVNHKKRRMK